MLPTGVVETRDIPVGGIQPQADGTCKIDVDTAFSQAPAAGLGVSWCKRQSCSPSSSALYLLLKSEDGIYGVSAVAYNSTIYDAVEV